MLLNRMKSFWRILMLLICGLGMATVSVRSTQAAEASHNLEGAESYVREFIDALVTVAGDNTKSVLERRSILIRLVEDNVDIRWAGKFVLGKYWRSITAEQQNDFINLYRDYLINTYAPYFETYSGESADVDYVEYMDEDDYSAACVFYDKNHEETLINLAISYISEEERFLMRDVVVEGISLLNSQRSDFTSSIANIGYNEFLQQMVEKIATLKSNGSKQESVKKSGKKSDRPMQ